MFGISYRIIPVNLVLRIRRIRRMIQRPSENTIFQFVRSVMSFRIVVVLDSPFVVLAHLAVPTLVEGCAEAAL